MPEQEPTIEEPKRCKGSGYVATTHYRSSRNDNPGEPYTASTPCLGCPDCADGDPGCTCKTPNDHHSTDCAKFNAEPPVEGEAGERCEECEGSGQLPTGECREAMSGPTCFNPKCPPCQTPETEPCPDCEPPVEGEGEERCQCCGAKIEPRNPDPWEGRMDRYCLDCSETRCDAFPTGCRNRALASGEDGEGEAVSITLRRKLENLASSAAYADNERTEAAINRVLSHANSTWDEPLYTASELTRVTEERDDLRKRLIARDPDWEMKGDVIHRYELAERQRDEAWAERDVLRSQVEEARDAMRARADELRTPITSPSVWDAEKGTGVIRSARSQGMTEAADRLHRILSPESEGE